MRETSIRRYVKRFFIRTFRHSSGKENEKQGRDKQAKSSGAAVDYFLSLTKEEHLMMPTAKFDGNIKLIDRLEDVDQAVKAIRSSDIVGFDTETRPSFKKGQSYLVSLLQLSTRSTCYLFRLNRTGLTDSLKMLLEDDGLLKIGLSIHDDFHNLNKLREVTPQGFVELQSYVKDFRISDTSLTKIYGLLFGKRISKNQRLSNWEAEHLSDHQMTYASLDAMACIDIYDNLHDGNFNPDLSPYKKYPVHEERATSE